MKNPEPTTKYSEAIARVEEILQSIQSSELDVDELVARIQEATQLIQFCKSRLKSAGGELDKLFDDLEQDLDISKK